MLNELMIKPEKRTLEGIETLKIVTSGLEFFKDISTKEKYVSKQIHEKMCKKLLHVSMKRGEAPILKSIYFIIFR